MDAVIGTIIIMGLIAIFLSSVFHLSSHPIGSRITKPPVKGEDRPERVSWQEVDQPLMDDWERRFAISTGRHSNESYNLLAARNKAMDTFEYWERHVARIGMRDMSKTHWAMMEKEKAMRAWTGAENAYQEAMKRKEGPSNAIVPR